MHEQGVKAFVDGNGKNPDFCDVTMPYFFMAGRVRGLPRYNRRHDYRLETLKRRLIR